MLQGEITLNSVPSSATAHSATSPPAGHGAAQESEATNLEVLQLLGPSPVVHGEDRERYDALLAAVAKIVKPADILDWMLVRDIIDNQWELLRCRLAQPRLIEVARGKSYFKDLHNPDETVQSEIARAIAEKLATLNALDAMVAGKEMRRIGAFRELERRRAAAKSTRDGRNAESITDAEYRVIEDKAA